MTDNREYFVNRISELSNRIVDLLEERDNLEAKVEQLQAVNSELSGQLDLPTVAGGVMRIEQLRHAKTPDQMRAEIQRMAIHDPLTYSCVETARQLGMSCEDMYTLMAYVALQELQKVKQREIDAAMSAKCVPTTLTGSIEI